MFDIVKRLLGNAESGGTMAPVDHILVAACALLQEMAAIDGEFSPEEQAVIQDILAQDFRLDPDEAAAVMEAARAERVGSIDLWRFTNVINENYAEADKLRLIETVWKVIYADSRLEGHEDYLVHMIAKLMRLSHSQLIEAKMRVKNGMG